MPTVMDQCLSYLNRIMTLLLGLPPTSVVCADRKLENWLIADLQGLVREFLDSYEEPTDYEDMDAVEKARDSLWQAFKRITGDARWPMLAAHLADYADAFYSMTERLEPSEFTEERKNPGEMIIAWESMDDMNEIIEEAYTFISNSSLYLIAEKADTEEWELVGLKPWCPWCSISESKGKTS